MMDGAEGPELTAEIVTTRVMVVNFAAIEVSANMNLLQWTLSSSMFAVDFFQCTFEPLW